MLWATLPGRIRVSPAPPVDTSGRRQATGGCRRDSHQGWTLDQGPQVSASMFHGSGVQAWEHCRIKDTRPVTGQSRGSKRRVGSLTAGLLRLANKDRHAASGCVAILVEAVLLHKTPETGVRTLITTNVAVCPLGRLELLRRSR